MFTVGEFARLAQVSRRLLRYYDEIGLLKPSHTDRFTDYRYYRADQLPRLNRILALKDLGLSLDQIGRLLDDQVSPEEIQGMLRMKKIESEQRLQEEEQRLRNIESRLLFLRNAEAERPLDVVVKQIPAQPALTVRTVIPAFDAGVALFGQMMAALPARSGRGLYFGIWHSGGPYEQDSDVELGCLLETGNHAPVELPGGLRLRLRELPAVATMATFVLQGPPENAHIGYSAIGVWAETNRYRFVDAPREIFLHLPQAADGRDGVTEIQYPVAPAA